MHRASVRGPMPRLRFYALVLSLPVSLFVGCTGYIGQSGSDHGDRSSTTTGDPNTLAPAPSTTGVTGSQEAHADLSTGPIASLCKTPTVAPARIWRLSRDQVAVSIKSALG